ncbi:TIGR03943 family putative permease subunit [Nocardioides sp.]|uniref:TIGR03943 family putative permease subunit n=1 Tax=Nocardioides sp. TaxID=35761 RepID=UPI0039E4AC38
MNRRTQALVTAFLGAVLVRLTMGTGYLTFVASWMRWPLMATGLVLIALSLRAALGREPVSEHDDDHDHGVPWATWLLLLPGLVVFVVNPPALGAYLAERRGDDPTVVHQQDGGLPPLPDGDPVDLTLDDLTWRASVDGETLLGRQVRVVGFVSTGDKGDWYVTRLTIFCCAADAIVERARATGQPAPPRNQWVQVTGTVTEAADDHGDPVLDVTSIEQVPTPEETYG